MSLTRRDSLALGAAALGSALTAARPARAAGEEVPTLRVAPPAYTIEPNAKLRVIRPAALVEPDATLWMANSHKFTAQTGVPVEVSFIPWEDVRPLAADVANGRQAADIVLGFSADPQMYASQVVDLTDLAQYLGTKYIGWCQLAEIYGRRWGTREWISIPFGGGASATVYRRSWLQQAGYDQVPDDLGGFLTLCQRLQKIGHPCGFSLGHAPGDATGFASWLLWTHNAAVMDDRGKVALDSKETVTALRYATELQKTMIPGTLAWTDRDNNQAFIDGSIGLTFNGVSIYYAVKSALDPARLAIAADTQHQPMPKGYAPRAPVLPTPMNAMIFSHSDYPNAAKEYLRFMMEADQYVPWLSACIGYWSAPLRAYSKLRFWSEDPQLTPFASAMETTYYDGYRGPVGTGSSAVAAHYVIVDMFASVVTGAATPEAAAKLAAEKVATYYGGT